MVLEALDETGDGHYPEGSLESIITKMAAFTISIFFQCRQHRVGKLFLVHPLLP